MEQSVVIVSGILSLIHAADSVTGVLVVVTSSPWTSLLGIAADSVTGALVEVTSLPWTSMLGSAAGQSDWGFSCGY